MSRAPRRIGQKRGDTHTLSLCMIVKNEDATLEQCLRLARPHVDEMVVVDTGSTDGTIEIARRYADVLEEIEWPESFSVARNHSFDLAGCDYILVLDGDEYIGSETAWKRIRKSLRQDDLAAVQLLVKNLMPEDQILAADRMWQTRILKNDRRIRYSGRVHNQIDDAVKAVQEESGRRVIRVNGEVVHTGYALSVPRMKAKYEPRLKLLSQEFENPRSDSLRAYYGYQLGVAYFVTHRFQDAAAVFNAIDYRELNPLNAFYTHLLAAHTALKLENAAMALLHCNAMLTLDRQEPVAYYTTGLALLQARQISDGLLMLLEAFDVNEAGHDAIRFQLNVRAVVDVLAKVCGRIGLADHERVFSALHAKGSHATDVLKPLIAAFRTNLVLAEVEGAHA
jgi:glycosyltransferase involved in cell wall biosynthesis